MDNFDPNAPAFGTDAQKVEETPVEAEVKTEEAKDEPVVESVEETKVPYSRFAKFHTRALEAEKEAQHWREIAEAGKSNVQSVSDTGS